jgi:Leucine-rich repeat (LRR) protein
MQNWKYFDPHVYAETVLRQATVGAAGVLVDTLEHLPHLRAAGIKAPVRVVLPSEEAVTNLNFVADIDRLIGLSLYSIKPLDISRLTQHQLETISILGAGISGPLELLSQQQTLIRVNLTGISAKRVAPHIAPLANLRELRLHNAQTVRDFSWLDANKKLTVLVMNDCDVIADATELDGLSELTSVKLANPLLRGGLHAFGDDTLRRLSVLRLKNAPTVHSLTPLANSSITELEISGAPLRDLSPIMSMRSLTSLHLSGCGDLELDPLAQLASLRKLDLRHCGREVDLSNFVARHQPLDVIVSYYQTVQFPTAARARVRVTVA